jgi:hypothetical protein
MTSRGEEEFGFVLALGAFANIDRAKIPILLAGSS